MIIVAVLTGIIFGFICLVCFAVGYHYGSKQDDKGITVTEENREFIEEMTKWKNFDGR